MNQLERKRVVGVDRGSGAVMPDGRFYPDILQAGGLAEAMAYQARMGCLDIGEVVSDSGVGGHIAATVVSGRGVIRVSLGADRRWFSVVIADNSHVWASGGSPELMDAIRVIESWCQGIGVEHLQSRFPFMALGALAVEYERGDHVAGQWFDLLQDSDLEAIRLLLTTAHNSPRLAALFPYVSHLTMLRIMRKCEDRTAGEIWITQVSGAFRVEDSLAGFSATVATAAEAVAVAESLV